MEEGSLLLEALSSSSSRSFCGIGRDGEAFEKSLLIDIFLLTAKKSGNNDEASYDPFSWSSSSSLSTYIHYMQQLAKVAVDCNNFFQTSCRKAKDEEPYPWHVGGDGPVFGIHYSSSSASSKGKDNEATTKRIPHLRAICRYGSNVADEWMAINLIMSFTREYPIDLAVECWDVDDGQVLLIQSANEIPEWVDQIGPTACRHRCWIVKGQVRLLDLTTKLRLATTTNNANMGKNGSDINYDLSLCQALFILQQLVRQPTNGENGLSSDYYYPRVQHSIEEWIGRVLHINKKVLFSQIPINPSFYYHKAPLVVPRSVALFLKKSPHLVNTAIVAFARYASQSPVPRTMEKMYQPTLNKSSTTKHGLPQWEDWVWTTHRFCKTNYAMLRTITTPYWKTEEYIPSKYQSIETKRFERTCAFKATPHIRYSLALGIRLVAAIEYLLLAEAERDLNKLDKSSKTTAKNLATPNSSPFPSSLSERRILEYWSRIDMACQPPGCHMTFSNNEKKCGAVSNGGSHNKGNTIAGGGQGGMNELWLRHAWLAGPNFALHNLDKAIIHCPVFDEEIRDCLTPLSDPETPMHKQIKNGLMIKHSNSIDRVCSKQHDFDATTIPRPHDVDNEDEWMMISDEDDIMMRYSSTAAPLSPPRSTKEDTTTSPHTINNEQRNNDIHEKSIKQQQFSGGTEILDDMLNNFQSFMVSESDVEGVIIPNNGSGLKKTNDAEYYSNQAIEQKVDPATKANSANTSHESATASHHSLVNINPRRFLNLFHCVLKTPSPGELYSILHSNDKCNSKHDVDDGDPFFSVEDYHIPALADDYNNDDDCSNNEADCVIDTDMIRVMTAMDQELKESTEMSRDFDYDTTDAIGEGAANVHTGLHVVDSLYATPVVANDGSNIDPNDSIEVTESAHVLSNLLKSIDASVGGPGPAQNIMKEMDG